MDERAYFDPDSAIILEVCDSLEEARKNKNDHGDGCAIFTDDGGNELRLIE